MFLTKWDPYETLSELQEEVGRLFDRRLPVQGQAKRVATVDWMPAVDIREEKEAFLFDVEVPGMKKEDLNVRIENHILSIQGERKSEVEKKEGSYYRVERSYGSFARSFTLPETADTEKINAEYKNGILQLKIAKKETAKPKQIQVQVKE